MSVRRCQDFSIVVTSQLTYYVDPAFRKSSGKIRNYWTWHSWWL